MIESVVAIGAVRPQEHLRRARPALAGLPAATAAPYLGGLGASGRANGFYSAAVQAGAHSWKAFFFGASDAASFITVDKTPPALWPMDLAARVVLVPQALMGVATVAVLYFAARRSLLPFGARAAAGGALPTETSRRRSPPGSRRTSPLAPSAAPRCTTCRPERPEHRASSAHPPEEARSRSTTRPVRLHARR